MSELAKSSPDGPPRPRPPGAAAAPVAPVAPDAPDAPGAPDAPAAPRPGVGPPDGLAGSKKPFGLPSDATSSMLRAACPASLKPGFSPTRGSFMLGFVACAGAGRSCATPAATA